MIIRINHTVINASKYKLLFCICIACTLFLYISRCIEFRNVNEGRRAYFEFLICVDVASIVTFQDKELSVLAFVVSKEGNQ